MVDIDPVHGQEGADNLGVAWPSWLEADLCLRDDVHLATGPWRLRNSSQFCGAMKFSTQPHGAQRLAVDAWPNFTTRRGDVVYSSHTVLLWRAAQNATEWWRVIYPTVGRWRLITAHTLVTD